MNQIFMDNYRLQELTESRLRFGSYCSVEVDANPIPTAAQGPTLISRLSSPKRFMAIASLFPGLNSEAPRDSAKLLLGERPTTGLAEFAQHFLEEIRNV
jgi:hypothetical protein